MKKTDTVPTDGSTAPETPASEIPASETPASEASETAGTAGSEAAAADASPAKKKADRKPEKAEDGEKKRKGIFSTPVRIIAAILAVLMIYQIIITPLTNMKFSKEEYEGSDYESVADYLAETTDYMSSSQVGRILDSLNRFKDPETYEDYEIRLGMAIASEEYLQAIEYVDKCLELFDGSDEQKAVLYIKKGCLHSLLDGWQQARSCFTSAMELVPDATTALLLRTEANLKCQDYEAALDDLLAYEEEVPLTGEQVSVAATLLLNRGDYAEAERHATVALQDESVSRADMLHIRAQARLMQSDFEGAAKDMDEFRTLAKDDTELTMYLAAYYQAIEDYAEAARLYDSILELDPQNAEARLQGLQCNYLIDNTERASELARKGIATDCDKEHKNEFYRWLGVTKLDLGSHQEACDALDVYLEAMPESWETYYFRGVARMGVEDYADAREDFTAAIDNGTLVDECLFNRAVCLMYLDDSEGATKDFHEIIKRGQSQDVINAIYELLPGTEDFFKSLDEE